jgi:uncharacterized membrane protein (DUF373 family)
MKRGAPASMVAPRAWSSLAQYESFERVMLRVVQVLLGLITVYAISLVIIEIAGDVMLGTAFMEKAVLRDTFGSILTILILLEFNHSVHVAASQKTGAVQVRIVVLITVLVIARKLMLLDYATVTLLTLLGFAALLLALGGLYWLIIVLRSSDVSFNERGVHRRSRTSRVNQTESFASLGFIHCPLPRPRRARLEYLIEPE